jgi:hypothetical protein
VRDFYRAFAAHDCRPADLALFDRTVDDLDAFVLDQDVIYVGGGNTASALGCGAPTASTGCSRGRGSGARCSPASARGMICWFEQSVTDSFCVDRLASLHDGLGLLAGSACPHYDGEAKRRPTYRSLVQSGTLSPGYAAETAPRSCSTAPSSPRSSVHDLTRPRIGWSRRGRGRGRRRRRGRGRGRGERRLETRRLRARTPRHCPAAEPPSSGDEKRTIAATRAWL